VASIRIQVGVVAIWGTPVASNDWTWLQCCFASIKGMARQCMRRLIKSTGFKPPCVQLLREGRIEKMHVIKICTASSNMYN